VRLARKAETAEQLGELLRERYERNETGMPRDSSDDVLEARLDALERELLGDER
jgi:hypothetical protein